MATTRAGGRRLWTAGAPTTSRSTATRRASPLDLKSDDGKALLEDLIRTADVLIENFRPGTMERLGFGPDRVRALNERLIYCSISGYGASGPRRDEPGYDMVIQGESGLMDVTGFAETGPTKVGVAITDCLAALYAVQGILLAHISRQQTGRGQYLDLALLDSAVSVLGLPAGIVAATGESPGRLGNAHPSLAPYQPYPAADGAVIVAVANPRLWTRFCAAIGDAALEHDPRFATNSERLAHRGSAQCTDHRRSSGTRRWTICSTCSARLACRAGGCARSARCCRTRNWQLARC